MHWMTRPLVTILVLGICSGCAAANFKPSELANTKDQRASAALRLNGQHLVFSGDAKTILENGKDTIAAEAKTFLEGAQCKDANQLLADAALVPLIAAIPKLLFDLGAEKRTRELEALKKASSRAYAVEYVLEQKAIEDARCLAVIRHDAKDPKQISALVLYTMEVRNDVLTLAPVKFWARNTIAATRKVKKGEKEKVKFLTGATLLGLGRQENRLPILATTGVDAEGIGSFSLGDAATKGVDGGIAIGPLPIPTKSKITVLRVSVTEFGDVGFNIDAAIARNKTIAEAIGPALKDAAKAYLEDD